LPICRDRSKTNFWRTSYSASRFSRIASRDSGAAEGSAAFFGSGLAGMGVVGVVGVVLIRPVARAFMAESSSAFSSGVSVELRAFSRSSRKRVASTVCAKVTVAARCSESAAMQRAVNGFMALAWVWLFDLTACGCPSHLPEKVGGKDENVATAAADWRRVDAAW
jgi:hypothetical protein